MAVDIWPGVAQDGDPHELVRTALPRLDWHALWAEEEQEEWILQPLIPARRLIALYSPAKTGKSLLMLEVAAALSTNREVLGHRSAKRYRVLYVDFENDPRGDIRPRLQDMQYEPDDLDHLDYLSFPSIAYLDTPQGANELLAAIEAYGSELVVIDTISRAVQGEENDNDTWLNFYKHTGLALKQAEVALIRLDHTGKDETKGQRGGSAKSGDVDAIWKLITISDNRLRLECMSSRFSLEIKELTLIRHDNPLHHSVEVDSRAADREAKITRLVERADSEGIPVKTGYPTMRKWANEREIEIASDDLRAAIRQRKNSADLTWNPKSDPNPQTDPSTDTDTGQPIVIEPEELTSTGQVSSRSGESDLTDLTLPPIGGVRGQDNGHSDYGPKLTAAEIKEQNLCDFCLLSLAGPSDDPDCEGEHVDA